MGPRRSHVAVTGPLPQALVAEQGSGSHNICAEHLLIILDESNAEPPERTQGGVSQFIHRHWVFKHTGLPGLATAEA